MSFPTTVADAASIAVSVVVLAIFGVLAAASVAMWTRWMLPPWRQWWRSSNGLSLRQRWQVGAAVQLCRRAKDPALRPALIANIALRRQWLAMTDRRMFRAFRMVTGVVFLAIALGSLFLPSQTSAHGPAPLAARALGFGMGVAFAVFLLVQYHRFIGWMHGRLDRCEALNGDLGSGGGP